METYYYRLSRRRAMCLSHGNQDSRNTRLIGFVGEMAAVDAMGRLIDLGRVEVGKHQGPEVEVEEQRKPIYAWPDG